MCEAVRVLIKQAAPTRCRSRGVELPSLIKASFDQAPRFRGGLCSRRREFGDVSLGFYEQWPPFGRDTQRIPYGSETGPKLIERSLEVENSDLTQRRAVLVFLKVLGFEWRVPSYGLP